MAEGMVENSVDVLVGKMVARRGLSSVALMAGKRAEKLAAWMVETSVDRWVGLMVEMMVVKSDNHSVGKMVS